MTEAAWFAVVAALALFGWALTLAIVTRAVVPMANALKICQGIVAREDDKVHSLAERALRLQNRGAPPATTQAPRAATSPMAEAFHSGNLDGTTIIDEQPDSELEITDAS